MSSDQSGRYHSLQKVSFSAATVTELMVPRIPISAGRSMGHFTVADGQSCLCLCGQARGNYCVTASIDTVDFLPPVEIGELVSLMASVNYTGNTSV